MQQQIEVINTPTARFMIAREYDDTGNSHIRLAPLQATLLHVRWGDGAITRYGVPKSWQEDAGIFERDKLLAEVCADPHRAAGEGWTLIDHRSGA